MRTPLPGPDATRGVRLTGVGHHFPGDPITNDDLDLAALGVDDAWVRERTGVRARHWPASGVRHADLAVRAARTALAQAGWEPADVDLIVGTSATARPRVNPTMQGNGYTDVAMPVQQAIGATRATCLDVAGTACAGFQAASTVVEGLLRTTEARRALVVCAENPLPILSRSHRNSVLFGSGAAAATWEVVPGRGSVRAAVLRTDARHLGAFDIDDDDKMVMKGQVVSDFAPGALVQACREALATARLEIADVDWVIPHQGNINIIRTLVEQMGLPPEKVLINIDRRGNTSSVSVPSCLSEHVHDGTIRPGDTILTTAIGRGFSWGAMVLTFDGAAASAAAGPAEPAR